MLNKLKSNWDIQGINTSSELNNYDINIFELENKVLMPRDLKQYFINVNGTSESYDDIFFQFYSLDTFKNVFDFYSDWEGVPNYKEIITTLTNYKDYYVFADYSFHTFSYAIKLSQNLLNENEVLVLCGGEFRIIANSFTEFLTLYSSESSKLFFED
ncbi:SMI1 / KNR4 family (SUKH-1) [Tenacibaculum sp. 190524A02b]|uniref:SMI1 / KNR4 family (SUKH-1) n=1 Tax=Tenacibaculum vairaonense TaxID=3137860 RepID=A0ABM9PQP4_9FLAO